MLMARSLLLFLVTFTLLGSDLPRTEVLAQIANDMKGGNEAHPHGVPASYGFYAKPVLNNGNNTTNEHGTNNAFTIWGTIYVDALGSDATNTRVAVRNCRAYWKKASTNVWSGWGPSMYSFDAADYPEDFQGSASGTDSRKEPDGSTSYLPGLGKTAHFYGPFPRIPIAAGDVGGIVAVCEARLVLNNPAAQDDRAAARFLANVGADYYPSVSGGGIYNNPSVGGGKFKRVTSSWRSFAMTTLEYSELVKNPPPGLDLVGVLP
jgi:hypothetical protein